MTEAQHFVWVATVVPPVLGPEMICGEISSKNILPLSSVKAYFLESDKITQCRAFILVFTTNGRFT
jgi:hypothetical protein